MQTLYDEVQHREAIATPRRQYVAGVIEGAPFDVVTCGGQAFQKFRDRVQKAPDGTWQRIPVYGGLTNALSDAEVSELKRAVAKKGIRGASGGRPDFISYDSAMYREHPSDQPVAKWLTLWPYEPVSEKERPPTLYEAEQREQARRAAEQEKAKAAEDDARLDPKDAAIRAAAARAKKHAAPDMMLGPPQG